MSPTRSQCPTPASLTHCKTLTKLDSFSELCCPYLQKEGPHPLQWSRSRRVFGGKGSTLVEGQAGGAFAWRLVWHCRHIALTKHQCCLGAAGV